MKQLFALGKKLYNCDRWINYRCVLVFMVRCTLHHHEVQALYDFLQQTPLRQQFFAVHPQVFAQLTRQFFYRDSSTAERLLLIEHTFSALEQAFSDAALQKIYLDQKQHLRLWSAPYQENSTLSLDLFFCTGEIREGNMTLAFQLDDKFIYHVNFWICPDTAGKHILTIGCHQGSRHGLPVNKALTKAFFGCRPKNFIISALQVFAQALHINQLTAVSNYGFYANNHLRRNRKLLVSYDTFWQECGGTLTDDRRFFSLPNKEIRKTFDEIPAHKRSTYRKRFAFLDTMQQDVQQSLQRHLRCPEKPAISR